MTVRPSASTQQLVERARNATAPLHEQHDAFAQLVSRSQHLVFSHALSSLRDVEEARDAAQDAFTTAWLRLPQLRDATLFGAWLRKIVVTQCHRRLRRGPRGRFARLAAEATPEPAPVDALESVETDMCRTERRSLVASAIAELPAGERRVTVLFYFLGHTLEEIARLLRLKPGTVGKRLHSARLRIRRGLSPSVWREFARPARTRVFIEKVRLGIFDEYVGTYRFERRPELVVSISRQGDSLISESGGQRNILASLNDQSLLTSHYDGEGRFRRNRTGKVTHFVYYEFGKRMGIARKIRLAR